MSCVLTLALLLATWSVHSGSDRVPVVYDLRRPAVYLDRQFATGLVPVAQCESGWDDTAVNRTSGARGIAQVHPIHRVYFDRWGIDYYDGADRLLYAEYLWRNQGWAPWDCAPEVDAG